MTSGAEHWLTFSGSTLPCTAKSPVITQSRDGSYLAAVNNKSCDILIYMCEDWQKRTTEPLLTLAGHRASPQCLTFSHTSEPQLLISVASDYIIKWNITECLINKHNGVAVRGSVVKQAPEFGVNHISLHPDDKVIALCTGCDVIVYDIQESADVHHLTGHTDNVTCAEFCPHYDSTLVTASVDRTYMIWNTSSGDLLYKSCIISSSPFESLIMNESSEEFILISEDGMIRIYDVSSDSKFSELKEVNIEKIIYKHSSNFGDRSEETTEGISTFVLSAALVTIPLNEDEEEELSGYSISQRSLFGHIELLIVVTASHCLIINSQTGDSVDINTLSECGFGCLTKASLLPLTCESDEDHGDHSDTDVYSQYDVRLISHGLMDDKLKFSTVSPLKAYMTNQQTNLQLSVINRVPVISSSPLRSSLVPKQPKPAKRRRPGVRGAMRPVKKSGGVQDQPVVFKTKVKSSGYSTTHSKPKMFQPQTKSNALKSTKSAALSGSSGSSRKSLKEKVYPSDAGPISKVKGDVITIDTRPTQIMSMEFSLDGQSLSIACSNQQAVSFKLPLNSAKTTVYSGHTGVVNSCCWSYSGQYLISSSNDKTVKLWSRDQANLMVTVDRLEGNMTPVTDTKSKKLQALPHETKKAQFFYLDKFILAACGNTVLMYKYHIDNTKNDIKRYENGSKYKLVVKYQLESAQQITSMSAINTFYSHLVLTTGSDRSIQVFDVNKSTQSRIVEDCHTKPAHHISQNKGSLYSNISSSSYELFLTSATGDGVKLWDLRSPSSCVRKFESHVSKAFQCGCDFSPDGRYVAAASEDRSFYIYDIGSGKSVSRVKGLSDVCSAVVYHPLYAQLAAGTINGNVAMYEA